MTGMTASATVQLSPLGCARLRENRKGEGMILPIPKVVGKWCSFQQSDTTDLLGRPSLAPSLQGARKQGCGLDVSDSQLGGTSDMAYWYSTAHQKGSFFPTG